MQCRDAGSIGAVKHRMGVAAMAFRQLKKLWGCPMDNMVKGRLYSATIRRMLLHGAGTWTMNADEYRVLETFEMSLVRSILKISKLRRITSVELRARLGITTSIREEVTRDRLRLFVWARQQDGSASLG